MNENDEWEGNEARVSDITFGGPVGGAVVSTKSMMLDEHQIDGVGQFYRIDTSLSWYHVKILNTNHDALKIYKINQNYIWLN